jgi:hypothetical protein
MSAISPAQLRALKSYAEDFEAPDYAEYSNRAGPALGWINRERVITALIKKGLIDGEQRITNLGRAILAEGTLKP